MLTPPACMTDGGLLAWGLPDPSPLFPDRYWSEDLDLHAAPFRRAVLAVPETEWHHWPTGIPYPDRVACARCACTGSVGDSWRDCDVCDADGILSSDYLDRTWTCPACGGAQGWMERGQRRCEDCAGRGWLLDSPARTMLADGLLVQSWYLAWLGQLGHPQFRALPPQPNATGDLVPPLGWRAGAAYGCILTITRDPGNPSGRWGPVTLTPAASNKDKTTEDTEGPENPPPSVPSVPSVVNLRKEPPC